MNRLKMLILDDCVDLLGKLQVNITKYDVLPATTLDEATTLAQSEDVSFIVADIRLRNVNNGYHVFERLFSRGKQVPGIVITAYETDQTTKKELEHIGVARIVTKHGTRLAADIEDAADSILADRRKRLAQLSAKVDNLGIGNAVVRHDGDSKTIQDWLEYIFAGHCSTSKEAVLKNLLVQTCNRINRPDDGRNYPFPEIGDVE